MIPILHSRFHLTLKLSYPWKHVVLTFLFILINYADKAVVGLASVQIMRDMGLTHREFGFLGSAFFALFSLSGVLVGFWANRLRTTVLMAGMGTVWALTLLPVGFMATSFGALLASRIVLGAAEGPAFPVALHSVYKWFEDAKRAVPTSLVACGAAFGTGVLAPLITWMVARYGWRTAFAALGVSGIVWVGVWLTLAAEGPNTPADARSGDRARPLAHAQRVPYVQLLSSSTAIGVFVSGFAAYWIIGLNLVWLANYLIKIVGISAQDAAWCLMLPSLSQMVLAPGFAYLSQRLRRRGWSSRSARGRLGSGCVILAGACVLAMSLCKVLWLKILLITLGFSVGSVIFTFGSTLIGEISPQQQRGAMLGITNSIHTLAGLCAPYLMGFMIDAGATPAAGFEHGFVSAGLLIVGCGALAAWLINPVRDAARFAHRNVPRAQPDR